MAAALFSEDPSEFSAYQGLTLPGELKPRLFIGPVESICNADALGSSGITHVLTIMDDAQCWPLEAAEIHRLCVEAVDDVSFDLRSSWPRCCEFIDSALGANGAALIHCNAGSSRSGATFVAYLMHRLRRPCTECLWMAQGVRNIIQPNEGFLSQLHSWERDLFGSVHIPGGAHMHQIRTRIWLGSVEAQQDWARLEECGITDVITCGRGLAGRLPDGVRQLCTLSIDDLDEVDILEHVPCTSDMIHDVVKDGSRSVLVHCAAGRSRSASVVIAYMMRQGLLYEQALKLVVSIRPVVQPNSGFSHQLMWYGRNACPRDLKDATSGQHYNLLPEFVRLLRRYSTEDVCAILVAAGVTASDCQDRKALQRALDALDRLQNAVPLDEAARDEKRLQTRRINAALD